MSRDLLCGLLVVWLALGSPAGAEPIKLTLEEAGRMALASHPKIRQSLAQIRQSQEQIDIVASPGRLQGNLSVTRDTQRTTLGPPLETDFNGVPVSIQADPLAYRTSRGSLEVRQLLFDGGRIAAQVAQARASTDQARHSLVSTANQLELDVALAGLDLLEARSFAESRRQAVDVSRTNLELAKARYAAGSAAQADVVYAEVPVARSELELEQMQQRVANAQTNLARLVGLPMDTELMLSEPVPKELAADPEASVQLALTQRPELLGLRDQLRGLESALSAAERENNPKLSAVGQIQAVGYNQDLLLRSPGWRLFLELNWPILDGNLAVHRISQVQAQIEEYRARLEDLERSVELEVRRACEEYRVAALSERSAQAQLTSTTQALEMAQGQYQAGVGTFIQVSQAQLEKLQAQQAQAVVRYNLMRALARLRFARGDSLYNFGPDR